MSCEANDACFRIQIEVSGFSHALRGPYRLPPTATDILYLKYFPYLTVRVSVNSYFILQLLFFHDQKLFSRFIS